MTKQQEREAFEASMKTMDGYPFAGAFANLMWKSWQARAAQAHELIEYPARVATEICRSVAELPDRDEIIPELRTQVRAVLAAPMQAVPDVGALGAQAVPQDVENLAINRYRTAPGDTPLTRPWLYKVVSGDGSRALYTGTKDGCATVARKLTEAFLDGAHAMLTRA